MQRAVKMMLGTLAVIVVLLPRFSSSFTVDSIQLWNKRRVSQRLLQQTTAVTSSCWNQAQVTEFAAQQGVLLSLTTLGPGFRGLARSKHNETQILGYVEGFIRPSGSILHLDKMEVFRKMVKTARKENPTEFKGGGSVFGVGLLVGYLCLLHGIEQGCSVAEFLAIDDEEYQHKRLLRYYKNSGFDEIKYVGDDWRDIPDRMIWGGCGTLLRSDIEPMLDKWTAILQKQSNKR